MAAHPDFEVGAYWEKLVRIKAIAKRGAAIARRQ